MANKNELQRPAEDFPGWYQEVVKRSGMAEHGLPKGSMVMKPHGYAVWERIHTLWTTTSRQRGTRICSSRCSSPRA